MIFTRMVQFAQKNVTLLLERIYFPNIIPILPSSKILLW